MPLYFSRDVGAFVSACDGSLHNEFVAANDFPRDAKYSALNEYEVMLTKGDEVLPGGVLSADDPN